MKQSREDRFQMSDEEAKRILDQLRKQNSEKSVTRRKGTTSADKQSGSRKAVTVKKRPPLSDEEIARLDRDADEIAQAMVDTLNENVRRKTPIK